MPRRKKGKPNKTYEDLCEALRGVIPWTLAIPSFTDDRGGFACMLCMPRSAQVSSVKKMLAHLNTKHPGALEAHRIKVERLERTKGFAGEPKSPRDLLGALELRYKVIEEEFGTSPETIAAQIWFLLNWAERYAAAVQLRYPDLTPLDPAGWKRCAKPVERLGAIRLWCDRAQRQLDGQAAPARDQVIEFTTPHGTRAKITIGGTPEAMYQFLYPNGDQEFDEHADEARREKTGNVEDRFTFDSGGNENPAAKIRPEDSQLDALQRLSSLYHAARLGYGSPKYFSYDDARVLKPELVRANVSSALAIDAARRRLLAAGYNVPDAWLTVKALGEVSDKETKTPQGWKDELFVSTADLPTLDSVLRAMYAAELRLQAADEAKIRHANAPDKTAGMRSNPADAEVQVKAEATEREMPVPVLDKERQRITLWPHTSREKAYDLSGTGTSMCALLLRVPCAWVASKVIDPGGQASRTCRRLPEAVRTIIENSRENGFRLNPEKVKIKPERA